MGIKYLEDPDLQFLVHAKNDDLKVLVGYLTKDKDGGTRWAQELLGEKRFKAAGANFVEVWDLIAAELQLFGGNSIVNTWRGNGVPYHELLCDVCSQLGGNVDNSMSAYEIENLVLAKLMEKTWEDMSPEQRKRFCETIWLPDGGKHGPNLYEIIKIIKTSMFTSFLISGVVAGSLATELLGGRLAAVFAEFAALHLRALSLASSAGILGTVPGVVYVVAGPAYRITLPCVVQIAYMRRAMMNDDRY
ncbi:MAG: DUF3944 domain-containing protein [Rhodocyclaceae bacterium]|nr:DUF3944 domain-containing protein [Rhodocyclaceae bacterium]MBX3666861.1 DUF3944 domain-containing protein [Rhodocyclaceae bacterium]